MKTSPPPTTGVESYIRSPRPRGGANQLSECKGGEQDDDRRAQRGSGHDGSVGVNPSVDLVARGLSEGPEVVGGEGNLEGGEGAAEERAVGPLRRSV